MKTLRKHELNGAETDRVEEAVVVAVKEAEAEAAADIEGEALQEEEARGRTLLASFALLLPVKTIDE